MCGRFAIVSGPGMFREEFGLAGEVKLGPRYNIAPSQTIPIIRELADGSLVLAPARWGLIPFWAKDEKISSRMINARAETLAEKPAYRAAYKKRRCLIPADGFFEWQKKKSTRKQPFYIHLKNNRPLAFAGLWEIWQGGEGEVISTTIVTTFANTLVGGLHDRMPLIVRPDTRRGWLDLNSDPIHDPHFTDPYDPDEMEAWPVSTAVNIPGHDTVYSIERI